MAKTKQKRAVSQATLNRLREMRRKYGLGEFKKGVSARKRKRPSTRVRSRARGRARRRSGSSGGFSRTTDAVATFAPSPVPLQGLPSGGFASGISSAPPIRTPSTGNIAVAGVNPRSAGPKRPVS